MRSDAPKARALKVEKGGDLISTSSILDGTRAADRIVYHSITPIPAFAQVWVEEAL